MGAESYRTPRYATTTTVMHYSFLRRWRPVMWVIGKLSYLADAAEWFSKAFDRFWNAASDRATNWNDFTVTEEPIEQGEFITTALRDTLTDRRSLLGEDA